jgi:hypothetical protein
MPIFFIFILIIFIIFNKLNYLHPNWLKIRKHDENTRMPLNASFNFFSLNNNVVISLYNQMIKDPKAVQPNFIYIFFLRIFKLFHYTSKI